MLTKRKVVVVEEEREEKLELELGGNLYLPDRVFSEDLPIE